MQQQDPWAEFRNPPPGWQQAPQRAPQNTDPIVRRAPDRAPDPYTVQTDQRDFATDRGDTAFSQARQLRQEFQGLPSYSEYTTALGTLRSALDTQPNAQGDQSLITSYAKMLDPNSAVREGEFATTAGTENQFNQLRARLARELGLASGGMLSEQGRETVRREMYNLVQNRFRPAYDRDRADYTALAENYGYDPALIIGTDPFTTYEARFNEAFPTQQEQQGNTPGVTPPIPMTTQDMYPGGAQLAADTWGQDNSFDRERYLQETYGIAPSDERRLVGALNARMRQGNMTADDVRGIYESLQLPQPDDAGIQQIVESAASGSPFGGIDASQAERDYQSGLDRVLQQQGDNPEGQGWSGVAGVSQGVTLGLGDELAGLVGGATAPFRGQNPVTAYQAERDLVRRYNERASEANPGTYFTGEIGGALATGGVRAAPAAMRAARPVAAAAREGAILGGVAGFGYGEGPVNSLAGAGIGAATGAAVGAGLQAGVNALAPRAQAITRRVFGNREVPDAGEVQPVLDAGERMGVTVRRADVDPSVRGKRGAALQAEGGDRLRAAEQSDLQAMEEALVQNLGGSTSRRNEAGEVIQGGIRSARERLRGEASANYRAASAEAGNVQVDPRRALDVIDQQIEELAANGANRNKSRIAYLRAMRQDIARRGGLSIDGLRAMRTDLRSDLNNNNLYSTDFERRITMALDAMSEDIAGALANNPAAAARYQRADQLWRQQAEVGTEIGDALLGRNAQNPLSAGQAAERVLNWASKDPQRLGRLLTEVDDATRDEVRALVVGQLGRQSNGEFQLGAFLRETSAGRGSKYDARALRALFGEDGVRAIADLRTLARAKTEAANQTNYSNTGGVVQRAVNGLRTAMLGAIGVADSGATGGAVLATGGWLFGRLGQERTLRLLMNPDFTGWLRKLPNSSNPRAIDGAFDRLRRVASRTPGMTADVQALERALIGAANDNGAALRGAVAQEETQADEN